MKLIFILQNDEFDEWCMGLGNISPNHDSPNSIIGIVHALKLLSSLFSNGAVAQILEIMSPFFEECSRKHSLHCWVIPSLSKPATSVSIPEFLAGLSLVSPFTLLHRQNSGGAALGHRAGRQPATAESPSPSEFCPLNLSFLPKLENGNAW